MRILLLSDPHYDFIQPSGGKRWLLGKVPKIDLLVVAGDVANYAWAADDFFRVMSVLPCPKVVCPGNHDAGYSKETAYSDGYGTQIGKPDTSFFDIAKNHGFITNDKNESYSIVSLDGRRIMIFNLFYSPDVSEGEMNDTNDLISFDVNRLKKQVPIPNQPQQVDFSVSHMCSRADTNPKYPRHGMFVNENIDALLRAHGSKLHFFGHTHQYFDGVIDGVRYVNYPIGYEIPIRPIGDYVLDVDV